MRQNFSAIALLFLALSGLIGYSAQAQEESQEDPQEKELKEINASHDLHLNDDKTLILETEPHKNPGNHPTTKEATLPSKASKGKSDKAPEEEDALSFNFLYYIINKFKISDIVDN